MNFYVNNNKRIFTIENHPLNSSSNEVIEFRKGFYCYKRMYDKSNSITKNIEFHGGSLMCWLYEPNKNKIAILGQYNSRGQFKANPTDDYYFNNLSFSTEDEIREHFKNL